MEPVTSPEKRQHQLTTVWNFQLQFLKGVGEKIAQLFAKADVRSLWDLLLTLPRSYEDRRHFHSFAEIEKLSGQNTPVLARAVIERYIPHRGGPGGRRTWLEAVAYLDRGEGVPGAPIHFTWFNDFGGSIPKRFPVTSHVIFRGKSQVYRGQIQIVHPDLQRADAVLPPWEFGAFVPVYREISGISTRVLRKILAGALQRPEVQQIPETLPPQLCERLDLPSLKESLRELHFPTKWIPEGEEPKPQGRYLTRLVFEELFMMALALHLRRAEWRKNATAQADLIPKILKNEQK